jgi:hypothetical protein
MVFHILPFLAVGAVKAAIKAAVDTDTCEHCGEEKKKIWVGQTIVQICKACEPYTAIRTASMGVKLLTLGVRILSSITIWAVSNVSSATLLDMVVSSNQASTDICHW